MGRGITNNAVEFLVQLAIDEQSSKRSIDKYLEKISNKTIKLTYSVNVGVSDKNISSYLEKHNGKVLKVDFDVNKGVSNRNFKTFLDSYKDVKRNVIFDVDKAKSEKNIKAVIGQIEVQKFTTEIDVAKRKSQTNINRFLNELNLGKKHIELDVARQKSKDNISTYLTTMNLKKVNVALTLAKNGLADVRKGAKDTTIKGIKGVLQLDVQATKLRIAEQIEKMKLPKFKVDVIANVVPSISKNAQIELERKVATPSQSKEETKKQNSNTLNSNKAKDDAVNLNGYVGTIKQVRKEIEQQFKEAGKSVHIFEGDIHKAQQKFIQQLEADGAKIKTIRDAQTKEITKITATTRNSANETISTVYKPLVATYDTANKKIKDGSREVRGFVAEIDSIDNKKVFDMDKSVASVTKKFEQAKHKGHIFGKELRQIQNDLKNIGNNDDFKRVDKDLDGIITKNKNKIELEKLRNNVFKQREQILANITRTEKLYRRTHDKDVAKELKSSVNLGTQDTIFGNKEKGIKGMDIKALRDYSNELSITQNQVSRFHAQATEATKNSMGILNSLKVAMEKFPIWMVASTAFYGTIRTLKTFGEVIIDIDKKMTNLQKVMSEDTDFEKVFESATKSAETFGKTISESMDAYVMFAKQGYKDTELEELSSAAIVAGNVGDIEAGKASEYMIASMLQWNKETSEAMGIIDSWNEISNNYATTVENLAQGQAKAGATSRSLGMDFDQLNAVIGTLNAKTKQSGNEIGNFWKSVAPNLVSNKGKSILDGLGISLEDDEGNLRDIMEIYKDVAKEYVKLNQADKNSVTLGLAGKYHISRMQTLLDDLGSADSMYEKMYETSQNSENSAMEENQKYMQSLEARINLARVEIEKLSLAIGEAFLTDGMITSLQLFSDMLGLITKLVSTVGALPVAFLATVTALTLFSSRFNDLIKKAPKLKEVVEKVREVTSKGNSSPTSTPTPTQAPQTDRTMVLSNKSMDESTESTKRNTTAIIGNEQKRVSLNRELSRGAVEYKGTLAPQVSVTRAIENDTVATDRNTEAKKRGSKALSLFTMGFGLWGVGLFGVGFALEKLIGKIGDAKKAQEDLEDQQEQTMASFKSGEGDIDGLIKRYDELNSVELDPNSEGYAELLDVQNQIAKILPDLKTGEDEYGNAIIDSSENIKVRVDFLKEQLKIEKELATVKAKEENEETNKEAKKGYKKSVKERDSGLDKANSTLLNHKFVNSANLAGVFNEDVYGDGIKDAEQLLKIIQQIDTKLNNKKFTKKIGKQEETSLKDLRKTLVSNLDDIQGATLEVQDNLRTIRATSKSSLLGILEDTKGLSDGAKSSFEDVASSAISSANTASQVEDVLGAFENIQINEEMQKAFVELNKITEEMKNSEIEDLSELEKKYAETFNSIKESILSSTGVDSKKEAKTYKNISTAIDNAINSQYDYNKVLKKLQDEHGYTREQALEHLAVYGETEEAISNATEPLEEYIDSLRKYSNEEEERIWYTDKMNEEARALMSTYEALINVTDRTTKEQTLLDGAMRKLSAIYPHLNLMSEFRADAVYSEIEAGEALREATELYNDNMLSSEEKRTVDQAVLHNGRIRMLQNEILAIQKVNSASYQKYEDIKDRLEKYGAYDKYTNPNGITESEQRALMSFSHEAYDSGYADKIRELDDLMVDYNSSLGSVISTNKKYEEQEKNSSSATDKASSATDKISEITEKYALQLEKVNTQLENINSKKKKYATHTSTYRKALADENKLLAEQKKLNEAMITELGTVKNTYTTEDNSNNLPSSTSNFVKPQGWNGKITSGYNVKRSDGNHTGIDVDGAIGDRLEANVSGKVLKAGDASKIGEHWSYGNLVIIQDEKNNKHYYAHLNDISVVAGQQLTAGTKIGSIGNTGNVDKSNGDGSHLHYEIRGTNGRIDPTSYVQSAKAGVTYNVNVNSVSSTQNASTGNSNRDMIWSYFKSKGLSDNAIAGILGNLQQESNFNPNAGKNAPNNAFGLAQWRGSRREGLNAFAKNKGTSANDLQTQLDFMWQELMGNEKSAYNSLQKSQSAEAHAIDFNALFERSGEKAGSKGYNNRVNYAKNAYNTYKGTGVISNPSNSSSVSDNAEYKAQQEQEKLRQANLGIDDKTADNIYADFLSVLEEFAYNRSLEDDIIQKAELNKNNLAPYSKNYENQVNAQYNAEKRKKTSFEKEIDVINAKLQSGELNEAQVYEQLANRAQLLKDIKQSELDAREYYSQIVDGRLSRFSNDRAQEDNVIANAEINKSNMQSYSKAYEKQVNTQYNAEKRKKKNYEEELAYLDKILKSGELNEAQTEEKLARRAELIQEIKQSELDIKGYYSEVVQGRLDRLDISNQQQQDVIDYERVKLQSVDKESPRYLKTLQKINKAQMAQYKTIQEEQKYVDKMLASGQLTNEMYAELTQRAKDLKKEAIEAKLAIQEANYEQIQIKADLSDVKLEDIDFELDRSKSIQSLYDDGTLDQLNELKFQLDKYNEKQEELMQKGIQIKSDMKGADLGHEQLEKLEKQLKDNESAWYNNANAIKDTEEAIKNFAETADEKVKDLYNDIADKIIDALKNAYEEARDIKMKAIEDELELEEKRHEKVTKYYQDELEMYNDIYDAKRREIEDSDRDRTHNNNIKDLEEEMQKLVERRTAISGITTYDAKKETKELNEQIAEVQKRIDEEYYQYSKELQLQSLDDDLKEKTENIEELQELEDEQYEKNIERLDDEKEYWNKHYDDLINNERRFFQIRDTLTKGSKDAIIAMMGEIETEIKSNIGSLEASLPDLEDTLNGTMNAVGKNIRDSVIFELEQLIDKMVDVQEEAQKIRDAQEAVSNQYGNSYGIRSDDKTYATDKENGLTENDLKVLLAKVARENIVQSLDPVKNEKRIDNIVAKTNTLAKEARSGENASSISATSSFDDILATLSQAQKQQVGKYFANNYGLLGFSTEEYNKYLSSYGSTYYADNNLSRGDSQVLMAKYMKEYSRGLTENQGTKDAINATANNIAKTGRDNGSVIVSSINYEEAIKGLSSPQLRELGLYMKENAKVIGDGEIRSKLEEYAERLIISNSSSAPIGLNDTAKMDTGGYTGTWGSSGGVDGKGGKYAVLHEREVVLNPIDTKRMFNISSIMESIMSKIGHIVKLPTLSKATSTPNNSDNSTHININIDKMNGTQSDIDNLSKQISNKLLREKGKR